MKSGNKGFSALLTEGIDDDAGPEDPPAESILASRSHSLARLATGKVVTDRTEFVDPERCRPWRMHNRDLDHLNEQSCRDLIDTFLSAKKQRIPAIVRRLRGDPDFDYEIVAGVRRWWTVRWLRAHHHPEFDYLVTVQQLTDEESFRVSDLENRSRKDITDWERAREYGAALTEFYEGSLARMAEHVNVSKSWLSRMLDVGRLPETIVAAFADPHDLTVRIARDIKPLLADAKLRAAMTAEADRIAADRAAGLALSGSQTAKRLIRAATTAPQKASRAGVEVVSSAAGKPMLKIGKLARGGGLIINVLPRSGAHRDELLAAIAKHL